MNLPRGCKHVYSLSTGVPNNALLYGDACAPPNFNVCKYLINDCDDLCLMARSLKRDQLKLVIC
jgi:hypothetical protein